MNNPTTNHPASPAHVKADQIAELRADIRYLTAQVVGMASAYETYAARHRSMGRAKVDALYGSRVQDYKRAAERAIEIARKYD